MKLKNKLATLLLAGALLKGVEGKAQTNIVEGPITNNITTTIFWGEQYLLDVQRNYENGVVGFSSNGWYDAGTNVFLEAIPNQYYSFDRWTGQTNTTENPLILNLDRPYTNLIANFKPTTTSQGTPYLWYVSHGITNNFEWHDENDFDGDEINGRGEYIWGTNPTNPESYPRISFSLLDDLNVLTLHETTNRTRYFVIGRESLSEGDWREITNSLGANGDLKIYINKTNVTFFYRGNARLEE